MKRLSINLLPAEYTVEEVKKTKFYKVQFISLAVVLVMTFLTSLTIALRILQSSNIRQVQAQLNDNEQRVSQLKDRQVSLFILKDRLTTINQYLGLSSKQAATFRLLDKLLPPQVAINTVSLDRLGEAFIVAVVPNSLILDNLVASLTSVSKVSIESLNRGKDGVYRISLKVKLK